MKKFEIYFYSSENEDQCYIDHISANTIFLALKNFYKENPNVVVSAIIDIEVFKEASKPPKINVVPSKN